MECREQKPGQWIQCTDRLPDNDESVLIWPLPDFGIDLHVAQFDKFHKDGPAWLAMIYEPYNGVTWVPINVTHWQPLPQPPIPSS